MKKRTCLDIFSPYFENDKEKFNRFLGNLSEAEQEKFFSLSIFYRNFVKNPPMEEFVKNSFAVLMVFSLIEALMAEEKFITFPEFLHKNFKPIIDKKDLRSREDRYYDKFGATRKAMDFFEKYVDEDCKKLFRYAIRYCKKYKEKSEDEIIKRNIRLFYKWRSDFVHSAKMPLELTEDQGIYKEGKNAINVPYKPEDLRILFEHGFLRYFKFLGDFDHGDIDKKIRTYQQHTGVKVMWE